MGYNITKKSSIELWAIVDEFGNVLWTGGGSSTNVKLLVYETEAKAKSQLKWTKKLYENENIFVKCVYKAQK